VALVLGAGGGLGRAVALELAREGAVVAVAGRAAENTSETVRAITEDGGRAQSFVWDLADLDAGNRAVREVVDALGSVDILFANTGGPIPGQAHGVEPSTWRQYFDAMVLPVISMTDAVLPGMKDRGWGRIVTCASSGVIVPIRHLAMSNTLRSSLVGWSKTLATEVAPFGVTSNIVVPGRIDTARVASLDASRAEREGVSLDTARARSAEAIPMGRYGEPREFARVVTFLASEVASYVTGSMVRVDGGLIGSV
jgi:3-oxoacyl-[acyl-carrier protein] reductase